MVEKSLVVQRGNAYVVRILEREDIEQEPVIEELVKKTSSPEELSDLIRREIPSLMNQLDLYIQVKEVDWSSPEINDQELEALAEELFKKFHSEKEGVR